MGILNKILSQTPQQTMKAYTDMMGNRAVATLVPAALAYPTALLAHRAMTGNLKRTFQDPFNRDNDPELTRSHIPAAIASLATAGLLSAAYWPSAEGQSWLGSKPSATMFPRSIDKQAALWDEETEALNSALSVPITTNQWFSPALPVQTLRSRVNRIDGLTDGQRTFLTAGIDMAHEREKNPSLSLSQLSSGYGDVVKSITRNPLGTAYDLTTGAVAGGVIGKVVGMALGGNPTFQNITSGAGAVIGLMKNLNLTNSL